MVCLDWLPEVKVGYVIVHGGFRIEHVGMKREAWETISMIEEMARLDPPPEENTPAEPEREPKMNV